MIKNTFVIIRSKRDSNIIDSGITVTQGDLYVNELNIRIMDGPSDIDYSQVSSGTITFVKSDGNIVQGNLIKAVDKFTYVMGTNEIACAGNVLASVQLFGSSAERLTTARFKFTVVRDLITSSVVQSTSEFPVLQQLTSDVSGIIATEASRVIAENARHTEVVAARGSSPTLKDRLDGSDSELANITNHQRSLIQKDWTNVTLQSYWTNYGEPYAPASYYVDQFGEVKLRGMVANGMNTAIMLWLPVEARPISNILVSVCVFNNGVTEFGMIIIRADGAVLPWVPSTGMVSLEGVSFKSGRTANVINFVPSNALTHYTAAMNAVKAGTGKCNIVFIGDSLLDGASLATPQTESIPGCVMTYFQGKYGNTGRGFIRGGRTNDYSPISITYTAGWGVWENYGCGKRTMISITNGSKATFAFSGTRIGIVLSTGAFPAAEINPAYTFGTITVNIDGALHSTLTPATMGEHYSFIHQIEGLAEGNHTIELIANVSENQLILFHGLVENTTTNDVYVYNCAASGTLVSQNADIHSLEASIDLFDADLVIVDGIGNDHGNCGNPANNINLVTYAANLNNIIDYAQAKGADVILLTGGQFMTNHVFNPVPNLTWNEFRLKMIEVATTQGVGLIDLINAWQTKPNGNQADWAHDNLLLSGSDDVHPGATGAQGLANEIIKIIDV